MEFAVTRGFMRDFPGARMEFAVTRGFMLPRFPRSANRIRGYEGLYVTAISQNRSANGIRGYEGLYVSAISQNRSANGIRGYEGLYVTAILRGALCNRDFPIAYEGLG